MSCLHPYSDVFAQFSSRLIFLLCVVLFLLSRVAQSQDVELYFPVFNDTEFTCTGIPSDVQKDYCVFNPQFVDLLPPDYNDVYPDQAGRMMYKTPIMFWTADNSSMADFSTLIIFSVSHVQDHPGLGAGIAFLIAPDIDTPSSSGDGSFGLLSYDYTSKQPVSGETAMVVAVEFDTALTPGIDTANVPHIGLDINSVMSSDVFVLKETSTVSYLDQPVAMWVDYNSSLQTISIYCVPIGEGNDSTSAASLKPDSPLLTATNFSLDQIIQRSSFIGISAGIASGEWESNKIFFWSFQTFGLPPVSLIAAWYQWFSNLSTTSKVGVIVGGVVGTVGGAYVFSECLFFCFFKRIKNPMTPEEQRWPVRRRKTLPGIKEPPPRKKARDSLSVASPLDLWGSPLEPEEGPHMDLESAKDPKGKDAHEVSSDSSDDEEKKNAKMNDTPIASNDAKGPASEANPEISEEEAPKKEAAKKPQQAERRVAFEKVKPSSSPTVKTVSPQSKPSPARKGPGPSQTSMKKLPPRPPRSSPETSPKAASPRASPQSQRK